MRNLLSANCLRLRKSVLFWALLAVSFAFGAFTVYTQYRDLQDGIVVRLDSILFFYAMLIGLFIAVFSALFWGTEYSDGAIRNKIASGFRRWKIYLANLLTGFAVSLLCCAATLLAVLAIGTPLFGGLTLPARPILLNFLGTVVMMAAFCAIYTAISMNCAKKAVTAVACILLFFGLMTASTYVNAQLDAPEYFTAYSLTADGSMEEHMERNPRYLQGTKREVYQFFFELLPTGQASQYTMMTVQHPVRLPLYALAITGLSTAAGIALFKRKDLK